MAVDAVTVALLAISSLKWEGTGKARRVNTTVMFLQLVALCGESPLGMFFLALGIDRT